MLLNTHKYMCLTACLGRTLLLRKSDAGFSEEQFTPQMYFITKYNASIMAMYQHLIKGLMSPISSPD